jgi:antitoxin ParD1/3/4
MSKNTSILLDDYFNKFINQQVKTGRFSSASEVVRVALRMFEQEESQKMELIDQLKKVEKSGFLDNFESNNFLNDLQKKHLKNDL